MLDRDKQLIEAVTRLDTRDSLECETAWAALRPLGFGISPYTLKAYASFRTWQGRTALVYYSTRYARLSEDAFLLGMQALKDKSYIVRYRACGLLAYSQREAALDTLVQVAELDERTLVQRSALAAINAIKARNHHLFVDWSLSGKSHWRVNDGDAGSDNSLTAIPSHFARLRLGIKPVPPIEP